MPDNEYYSNTVAERDSIAPTGIPTYTYRIRAAGAWAVSEWLTLSLRTAYTIAYHYQHSENRLEQGFEISFSLRFTPKGLRRFSFGKR